MASLDLLAFEQMRHGEYTYLLALCGYVHYRIIYDNMQTPSDMDTPAFTPNTLRRISKIITHAA